MASTRAARAASRISEQDNGSQEGRRFVPQRARLGRSPSRRQEVRRRAGAPPAISSCGSAARNSTPAAMSASARTTRCSPPPTAWCCSRRKGHVGHYVTAPWPRPQNNRREPDETPPRRQAPRDGLERQASETKDRQSLLRSGKPRKAYEGDAAPYPLRRLGPTASRWPERTCFPISPETMSSAWRPRGFGCAGRAPRTPRDPPLLQPTGRWPASPPAFRIPIRRGRRAFHLRQRAIGNALGRDLTLVMTPMREQLREPIGAISLEDAPGRTADARLCAGAGVTGAGAWPTEAVAAMVDAVLPLTRRRRSRATSMPENPASRRCWESAGFKPAGEAPAPGAPAPAERSLRFELDREAGRAPLERGARPGARAC